jgi:hypothetical protein
MTGEEQAAAAYLAVVQDFAAEQAEGPFCLSPVLSYQDAQSIPESIRETLSGAGFEFVRMAEPPDTSVRVLTLFPIEGSADSLRVTVDLMGTSISSASIRGWSYAWDYLLDCERGRCRIVGKTAGEHADLVIDTTSSWARAILSGQGTKCPSGLASGPS